MTDRVRVLVPIDGSPQGYEALEHALVEVPDGDITVLNVIDPVEAGYSARPTVPGSSQEWFDTARADADEAFDRARDIAGEYERTLCTAIELGRPARTIVDYADGHDIDRIVMGSHGRSGISRILLGSVAETVVRRSPVPVTVVR